MLLTEKGSSEDKKEKSHLKEKSYKWKNKRSPVRFLDTSSGVKTHNLDFLLFYKS